MTLKRRVFLAGFGVLSVGSFMSLPEAADLFSSSGAALAKSFASPPDSARPWVIWFWINGNVTREGITADLEAMRRVGIGGAQIMDVDPGVPPGPAQFGSGGWNELLDFALAEAERLGLGVELNDADGWTGSAGPWITPELSMQKVVWSEIVITGALTVELALQLPETSSGWYRDITVLAFPTLLDDPDRIQDISFKAGFQTNVASRLPERGIPSLQVHSVSSGQVVDPKTIIDLSGHMSEGRLHWEVPQGRWTIMRIGHTSTGSTNHPASSGGLGLECDKLSREAIRIHLNSFIGLIAARNREFVGSTLRSIHIDSWEVGAQNWTADFASEFKKRRNYDPLPWLPALSGRVVGDPDVTERFLWDMRKTISDLVVENYAAEARRILQSKGLRLSIEAYDADPTEQVLYGAQADDPQTEFWYGRDFFPGIYRSWDWTAAMTSSAHVYGRRLVKAEAFTSMPEERWLGHPATMKPLGDWAFSAGVNHFIFHRYAMQPWSDYKPGLTMGAWGIHYERSQTWWELSGPWHSYLSRCQHMLRQGIPVADLLYLVPEGAPGRYVAPHIDIRDPTPPDTPGYNNDGCPADALFTRVRIVDGQIVLPDGKRYHALVLADPAGPMAGAGEMTPETLARIVGFVEQGMTLIGPPPRRSPSLDNYPYCDDRIRALTLYLWGTTSATQPVDRKIKAGRVVNGMLPEAVLAASGLEPDFSSGEARPFRYTHRRLDDGGDLYFVANKHDREVTALCSFRARANAPEVWHPETGDIRFASEVISDAGTTRLPLTLQAHEAVFVLFPAMATPSARPAPRAEPPHQDLVPLAITGPWQVSFPPGWGAPATVRLPKLISWTESQDPGIRYFSGTATYETDVDVPAEMLAHDRDLVMDLGDVAVIAKVRVNGHDLGILWKRPFVVPIREALRSGRNQLSIEVTNLWPNRMIGDELLLPDAKWISADVLELTGFGEKLVEWPQWVLDGTKSPTGRYTFTSWKLWSSKDHTLPSGLLGPVLLRPIQI